jgi:transketolase
MLFDLFARNQMKRPYLNLGVEGGYRFELGTRQELHEQVGIGPLVVAEKIQNFLANN